MIVVVEGPDGSGKTTLANKFVELGFSVHHEGVPTRDDLLQYYAGLVLEAHTSEQNIVFDRLHIGELVYGPVMRGKERMGGYEGFVLMNRLLYAVRAKIIMCLPAFETCVRNRRSREEYVDDVKFPEIYHRYVPYAGYGYRYDYEDSSSSLLDAVTWATRVKLPKIPPGVIGSGVPLVLIVGEKANHPWLDLPFFSTTGSSHFLFECLKEAGYSEDDIALVNALTLSNQGRDLHQIFTILKPSVVIALGNVARTLLDQYRVPSLALPHPQYIKRFKSSERDAYVEAFSDAREHALSNACWRR